jgi:hypothetical protein
MKIEYKSDILLARELEDTVRATRKYTKGAFSRPQQHPIQGDEFPSKVLTEYYEVYPDLELGWDMQAGDAWAWVWGDRTHIDVIFLYDYRSNRAKVTVHGGLGAVKELKNGIPGFKAVLAKIEAVRNATENSEREVVGRNHRVRTGTPAHS